MKSDTAIKLSAAQHRALELLAFRAGATVEQTAQAIIQNALGVSFAHGSLNYRVIEISNDMPALKRHARAA